MRAPLLLFLMAVNPPPVGAEPPKVHKIDFPEQPAVALENTYTLKAGDVLMLTSDKGAKWDLTTKLPHRMVAFGETIVFNAPASTADGTEFILGVVNGGDRSLVLVKITNSGVLPVPVPVPPGPTPPGPPNPPDADLVKKFQNAYDADKSVLDKLKPKALETLIALYTLAQMESDKKDNTSSESLRLIVKEAGNSLMEGYLRDNGLPFKDEAPKAVLKGVRELITEEMFAAFPDDVELTDDNRKKIKGVYRKIETALRAVKLPSTPAVP